MFLYRYFDFKRLIFVTQQIQLYTKIWGSPSRTKLVTNCGGSHQLHAFFVLCFFISSNSLILTSLSLTFDEAPVAKFCKKTFEYYHEMWISCVAVRASGLNRNPLSLRRNCKKRFYFDILSFCIECSSLKRTPDDFAFVWEKTSLHMSSFGKNSLRWCMRILFLDL